MSRDLFAACLSAIDEERFGIRVARAPEITQDTLSTVMDFCQSNDVMLLIARCPVSELRAVQSMESAGFRLMDTLVYCARSLREPPIPEDRGRVLIRPARPDEKGSVQRVAVESLSGYFGHYHADPRLDPEQCDQTYLSWATRSCESKEVADEVIVADLGGDIVGFFALKQNSPVEAQDVPSGTATIGGVSPRARGQGVYRSLMVYSMQWCLTHRMGRMVVSSQITNVAVQKVWARLGFEPLKAYYTLHKWFDLPDDAFS